MSPYADLDELLARARRAWAPEQGDRPRFDLDAHRRRLLDLAVSDARSALSPSKPRRHDLDRALDRARNRRT